MTQNCSGGTDGLQFLDGNAAALLIPGPVTENPYWKEHGITVEDPDGWRVVLQNTRGLGA